MNLYIQVGFENEKERVQISKNRRKLLSLFKVFFRIGLFTFGGGFAMIPLMEKEIVENKEWIEKEKFIDAISITQSVPGAVAINLSIFFGYNIAGIIGAFTAAVAVALPSFMTILLIALSFNKFNKYKVVQNIFKGIRPAVVGLILYAGMDLSDNINWSYKLIITLILVFVLNSFLNVNPIFLILTVFTIGSVVSIIKIRKQKEVKKEET